MTFTKIGTANVPAVTEQLRVSGVKGSKKEINMRLNAIAATLACALVIAAAASSAYAQYYYGPEPSYAYVAPAYPYAAPPAYGYVYVPPPACWNSTSDSRNYGYYGSCAYGAIDTDAERLGQARPNRRLVR